jgi:hypothetical protein
MKTALLLQLLGSFARHFLPWATALLAGAGFTVTDGTSPLVTLALAIAFYLGAQAWSFLRKWWAAHQ